MTRLFRPLTCSLALVALFGWMGAARAADPVHVSLDATFATKGKEIRIGSEFILGMRNNIFSTPAQVTLTPSAPAPATPLPTRYQAVSGYYQLAIDTANVETFSQLTLWLQVAAPVNQTMATALLVYDPSTTSWSVLSQKMNSANMLVAETRLLHATFVVANDGSTAPGTYGADVPLNASTLLADAVSTTAVTLQNAEASFVLNAFTLSAPAKLIITPDQTLPLALPSRYVQRSKVYYVTLRDAANASVRMANGLVVQSKLPAQNYYQQVALFYNPANKVWERTSGNRVFTSGYVVIVNDRSTQVGMASWYRSAKNPDGVANNQFAMGTKLRVTNVENGKSTVVRVVSRGPFVAGRVIDLVYTAFKKIQGKNAGVARVSLAVVDPKVLGDTVVPSSPTPAPTTANTSTTAVALPISSASGVVYDVDKGVVVAAKNVNAVQPIASLTKLMSGLVLLDQKISFTKVITYQTSDSIDNWSNAYVHLNPGEQVTASDLWHAMFIGSANNAVLALVRTSGLTQAQFVQRMNDKAKTLGLTTLHFTDPTGLETTNQGSAADLVKLAAIAFQRSEITSASTKTTYTFSTINTKVSHTIKNLNAILTKGWNVTGTKTGFLNESGYCLITQVKGMKTGRTIVVANLGASSLTAEYTDMLKAFDVGYANIK